MVTELRKAQVIVRSEKCGDITWRAGCIKTGTAGLSRPSVRHIGSSLRFSDIWTKGASGALQFSMCWIRA